MGRATIPKGRWNSVTLVAMLVRFIDSAVWFSFLSWLIIFSFITTRFDSNTWLQVSAAFYLFVALGLVAHLVGCLKINEKALLDGAPIIVILTLSIMWLGVQSVFPVGSSSLFDWQTGVAQPTWFSPSWRLSVTPEKTRWLMLSTLLVLTSLVAALALIRSRARFKQVVWTLGIVAIVHAILGILAMKSGVFLVDESTVDGHFGVARGWYINRNHYAAFLLTTGCGALAVMLHSLGRWNRNLNWLKAMVVVGLLSVALLAVLLAIILSQSRAGLLAPGVALALTLLIAKYCGVALPWRRVTHVFFVLALGMTILFVWQGEAYLLRLKSLSIGERILQWQITLQVISESPWFGFGGGSYATVFQVARGFDELRQVVYNQAHNQYLQLWLEQGLVGLGLWVTMLLLVLVRACQSLVRSRSKLEQAVILSALIALFSASLQAMVDFNLQIVNLRIYFFLWVALIMVAPSIHKTSSHRTLTRNNTNSQGTEL